MVLVAFLPDGGAQPGEVTRENGRFVRRIYGSAPAVSKLRINTNGPVVLEGGVSNTVTFTVRVEVSARTEAEGRRVLRQYAVKSDLQGQWLVLTAPGGAAMPVITIKTPRLSAAVISTSLGGVDVRGVEGSLDVDTGAGALTADRIRGDARLITGGGDISVGDVSGSLHCTTGAGAVRVKSCGGQAVLETNGGDITALEMGGMVRAETGGGGVRIGTAEGAVSATTGGGEIVVEKAGGIVTLKNMAGPVQVGSAAGVRVESLSGGIRLHRITGPIRVSTSMGSIIASLLAGRFADSFLATGNGDITVLIPSNVGVTIHAQNQMADSLRRIESDFREIPVRRQGTRLVAEGSVNGGGPLLQISGTGGTIFLKRQP